MGPKMIAHAHFVIIWERISQLGTGHLLHKACWKECLGLTRVPPNGTFCRLYLHKIAWELLLQVRTPICYTKELRTVSDIYLYLFRRPHRLIVMADGLGHVLCKLCGVWGGGGGVGPLFALTQPCSMQVF